MATENSKLRSLVDRFVADLSSIVHDEALDTVRSALGAPAPRRRGPGRPRKAGRKAAARRTAGRKAGRRSPEEVTALGERVLAHVKANPGQRLEEIGRALGIDTQILKRPIANLMRARALKTQGQKRGTKYFAGKGGRGGVRRKAGKRGRRAKAA